MRMPHYFFHIRDDDRLIEDEEGVALTDIGAARKEAVLSGDAMILESLKTGEPLDHVFVEIWTDRLLEVVQVSAFLTDGRTVMH